MAGASGWAVGADWYVAGAGAGAGLAEGLTPDDSGQRDAITDDWAGD
jgi:hypothetical protein